MIGAAENSERERKLYCEDLVEKEVPVVCGHSGAATRVTERPSFRPHDL